MSERCHNASWTAGYVDDVVYTLGFHRELAPTFLDYVCLIGGVDVSPIARTRRYCELGCGRGFGTVQLAAANPDIDFVGIDFNPSHISEARALAERAEIANVEFLELSFGDAARSGDAMLAEFDIVALHGVYSWVAPDVREEIHEFLRAKLVSGGIAFVSYNAMPGWARVIPTQRLLLEAAARSTGDSLARVAEGMQLLELLIDQSDGMVAKHGALSKSYLTHLAGRDKHYLVHEFLGGAWKPLFVTEAITALAGAGMSYAGSATVADNRIEFCVPKKLRETVRATADVGMRELLKDFIVGKQFRRDVYAKGPRQLSADRQRQRLAEFTFAPMPNVRRPPEKLRLPVGEVAPDSAVVDAMWECVAGKLARGAEFLDAASRAGEKKEERVWALLEMLVHNGLIHPSRTGPPVDPSPSRRLNEAVMELSKAADTHRHLASPVLGSAIPATYPERVIAPLLAREPDLDDVAIAEKAFDCVRKSGLRMFREGRPIEKSDETARAFGEFVREFREHRLPAWRLLGVIQ